MSPQELRLQTDRRCAKVQKVVPMDIHVDRRAEEEMPREGAIRLNPIFNGAPDGILIFDAESGQLLDGNPKACAMLSYERDDFLHMNVANLHIAVEVPGVLAAFRTLHTGSANRELDVSMRRKDGSTFQAAIHWSRLKINGRICVMSFFRDVMQHQQAQATALSIAKEAAQTSSRIKSVFLSNVSHELRTPLNSIMGMTYLAQRRVTDPTVANLLAKALGSSNKLLSLINGLIDVSNVEADRLILDCSDFCIGTLLERVSTFAQDRVTQKGFELVLEVGSELRKRSVQGDPLRLGQILNHLVDNAFKFSQRGPVTLRIQVIDEKPTELTLLFEVEDRGIGIAAEDQKKIFSTFEQVDGSSTRQHGGIGLGLTLSKRLVKQMGGSIGVRSQPGAGSCFWFTAKVGLPAALPDTPAGTLLMAHSAVSAADSGRLQNACRKLLSMMDAGEWDVLALIKRDANLFRQVSPAEFQRMSAAAERFDFDEAAGALKAIMQMLDTTDHKEPCQIGKDSHEPHRLSRASTQRDMPR